MKKVIMLLLALVLVLAVAGAGWAANSGQAQTICPVLGGKINRDVCADYQGQRVYFCCPGCEGKFQQAPEKYLKKLKEQGVTPDKTPAGK